MRMMVISLIEIGDFQKDRTYDLLQWQTQTFR